MRRPALRDIVMTTGALLAALLLSSCSSPTEARGPGPSKQVTSSKQATSSKQEPETHASVGETKTGLPGDTTVYHAEGKKRVHVKACRRLTTDPKVLATMTKMTLAEAKARGLPLCSRCPGSTTPGKGKKEADKDGKD